MHKYWKNVVIIIILFLSIIYALPNIFGSDLAVQISKNNINDITITDKNIIINNLKHNNINYKSIKLKNNKVLIRFSNNINQLKAKNYLKQKLGRNFTIALNLANSTPNWLSYLNAKALSLGLDLRGGVHFLLEVDTKSVIKDKINKNYYLLRSALRENKLYKNIKIVDNTINIILKNLNNKELALKIIRDDFSDFNATNTGNEINLTIKKTAITTAKKYAIKQNISTLKNRVNELGVAEPIIQQQGMERIIVQLPGVQDTTRAKEILGSVATIEFRLVDEQADVANLIKRGGNRTSSSKLYYFKDGIPLLLKNRIIVTGDNVIDAASGVDNSANPMVNLTLDSAGGKAMLSTTKKYLNHRMAVLFIENKVNTIYKNDKEIKIKKTTKDIINAATIRGTFSTRFQITGLDSAREARNLALLLRAGSLSAPIEIIEERTIGPSLGADNIKKGFISVIVGFILVLLFMAWRYRVFGIIADIALFFNLIIIIAVLSSLQATLTLPGIAAIVLTVGMAVDANVLIFERIKEELRSNSNIKKAISGGYAKAFKTIADANITTLIAAIVLFSFGTGAIKGFAITLSIGVVTSMFTAIVLSRMLVNFIYKNNTKNLAI